ncbi:MAG: hypothetical protein K6E47_08105 [Lachnospiraceae bacterium]|nr:hypothetical protein [Lachnospiraceae bacterium]
MKVIFVSCDPGGTNCLIPIYMQLCDTYSCSYYSKGPSVHLLFEKGISFRQLHSSESIDNEEYEIKKVIQTEEPDLIITGTSSDDFVERLTWRIAREKGIKTICILDAWCGYIVRFSDYTMLSHHKFTKDDITILPDYIVVPDDSAKNELLELGVESKRIEAAGHPYLEFLRQNYDQIESESIEKYKCNIGAGNRKIILYASDNLSQYSENGIPPWGFDERSTFDMLEKSVLMTCNSYYDYFLIIRPHPKEDRNYWNARLKNAQLPIEAVVDSDSSSIIEIMSSDLVVGSFTMLLNEALIAGKKVISIQINSKKKESFYAADKGLLLPCYTEEDLERNMKSYFMDLDFGTRRLRFQNNAIKNICGIVKRELEKKA